jgi:hypothetical protein
MIWDRWLMMDAMGGHGRSPLHNGMEWVMKFADPEFLILILIVHSTAVAGRGGLAGIQDDVLAVLSGCRGSEQRVYGARS